eukprot:scaffold73171_cov57-Phaeocystis_antarctica.AAC.1
MIIDPTVDEVDTLDGGPIRTFPHAEKDVFASGALVQVATQAAADDSLPSIIALARLYHSKIDHIRGRWRGRRRGRRRW